MLEGEIETAVCLINLSPATDTAVCLYFFVNRIQPHLVYPIILNDDTIRALPNQVEIVSRFECHNSMADIIHELEGNGRF